MKYLHNTSVKFHGNLTSTRCVIDSHWVVKITDWGLHEFKAGQENTKSLHKMYYGKSHLCIYATLVSLEESVDVFLQNRYVAFDWYLHHFELKSAI